VTDPRDEDNPGVRRAWGWVAHLHDGGTTPWCDWSGEAPSRGRVLPGAQQLELLRRLNLAGTPTTVLAGRVLAASAPGRGRPDLELAGAVEPLAFGPSPIDPADLPDEELVRVATSLLADDVVAAGLPPHRPPGRVRPWRTRYRIVGDPALAEPIRAELTARGRPPGGRGSVVLVVGTDLGQMLVDAWTSRCFDEGAPTWRDWLGATVQRPGVPPRVDLVQAARTWSEKVGPERVRIVLDPAAVPRLVGVRRALTPPAEVSADGVELARGVAAVLGLLVPRDRRRALLRQTLRPRLAAVPGPPLAVPPEHAPWLQRRAVRMREALLRAGYAVHGDPDILLPDIGQDDPTSPTGHVVDPSDAGTLRLAVRLLLDGDRAGEGQRHDGEEGT
jgi:hypothetical protein